MEGSILQVRGNRSTVRKPTTFGRSLTNSSHMSVVSLNRDSNPRGERRYPDDCATKAPTDSIAEPLAT